MASSQEGETNVDNCSVDKLSHVSLVRTVNLILDSSALVRGIGNVKRWFNQEYIESQLMPEGVMPSERVQMNIYLPLYTLHELEYLKRGSSIVSSNSREALKFIDQTFDNEDNQFDGAESSSKKDLPLHYSMVIEQQGKDFPLWNQCYRFKIHDLKVKDFPYHQTRLAQSSMGGDVAFSMAQNLHPEESPEDLVQTPRRLKYLIRSCVYKRYLEKGSKDLSPLQQWKLVTEDSVTRVWANSYGIDCLNVNEAELLIFLSMDVTSFDVKQEGRDFNSEHDLFDQPEPGILHRRIDTTEYEYHPLLESKAKAKLAQITEESARSRSGPSVASKPAVSIVNGVKQEDFNMINYAPRVTGKLWTSSNNTRKKR